jgi:hypothetical protein
MLEMATAGRSIGLRSKTYLIISVHSVVDMHEMTTSIGQQY